MTGSGERTARIDLESLASNVRTFKSRLGSTRLMAVVKADAYGHGMAPVARAALAAGADAFGVAHVREGVDLRAALGAGPRILAWLHTTSTDFVAALEADLEIALSGPDLDALLAAGTQTGISPRVHVKVDTGLGRNGVPEHSWDEFFRTLKDHDDAGRLTVVGIMTHLAVADEPQRPETDLQKAAFERAVDLAAESGLTGLTRHAANTPAALTRTDLHYDMARIGVGIYGLSPFEDCTPEDLGLTPVMTLSTSLSLVKAVPAGQGVSYGLNFVASAPTHLGLVPVGYADGIPRIAEGAEVLVGGRRRPVLGRIAMDQMVVDLGPEEDGLPQVGDEVIVFGAARPQRDSDAAPSAADWGRAAQTINYEIVTRISPRVDRAYVGVSASHPELPLGRREVDDAEAMRALGSELGKALDAGDVVVLSGPLGAGKTTLTQGIARGLGTRGAVISPTFVLSRIHPNAPEGPRPGGPDLVHVDAYRLGPDGDLDDLGLDDTLERSVTVVEWGENMNRSLGRRTLWVTIERAALLGGGIDEDGSLTFDDDEAEDPRTVTIELVDGTKGQA
jgi:alanine racemase